jgi:hypothetical protein
MVIAQSILQKRTKATKRGLVGSVWASRADRSAFSRTRLHRDGHRVVGKIPDLSGGMIFPNFALVLNPYLTSLLSTKHTILIGIHMKTIPDGAVIPEWLEIVRQKVESLNFGVVQIVVHERKVTQIERTEKTRLDSVQSDVRRRENY